MNGDPAEDPFSHAYTYDPHGNMSAMLHLVVTDYDHADRLQHADLGDVWFVYDSAGNRVRKIRVNQAGSRADRRADLPRRRRAVPRATGRRAATRAPERSRSRRFGPALPGGDAPIGTPTAHHRYQYSDHLGSASLELDAEAMQTAEGAVGALAPVVQHVTRRGKKPDQARESTPIGDLRRDQAMAARVKRSAARPATSKQDQPSQGVRKLQRRQGDKDSSGLFGHPTKGVKLTRESVDALIDEVFAHQAKVVRGEITTGGPFKGAAATAVFDNQGRGVVLTNKGDFVTFVEESRGLKTVMKVNP